MAKALKEGEDEIVTNSEKRVFLQDYLDSLPLSKAEKVYYSRHLDDSKQKTTNEWSDLIKTKQ